MALMSLENAAKFLVVAWVKDWSMRTLLNTLDDSKKKSVAGLGLLEQAIPFMTSHPQCYFSGKYKTGCKVRQYVHDLYPRLSEALLAAKDDATRLKLAPQIERLQAKGRGLKSKFTREERNENVNISRAAVKEQISFEVVKRRHNTNTRSAWNVCKK